VKIRRGIGVILVVIVTAVAVVKLTAGHRAASARKTLERAAAQFVACYERAGSYAQCDPGTSKVMVEFQNRRGFAVMSTVEFGPTYEISRERDGTVRRSCSPRGERCPVGNWEN
jgi:hypothetical protein